jgi:DNA primase
MDQVAQVRERIDIVELLSEFLTVKKAGRNFKAVCPFHNEKSPSFVISPERQIWHCFGCSKGGDVFTFLMDYEHLEFPEALRLLAKRAGIELTQDRYLAGQNSKKEAVYKVNKNAADFYHFVLTKHPAGKKALAYLAERGITDKLIETFAIGYAPRVGSVLSKYLLSKKKHTEEQLLEAGLVTRKGYRLSDFFFNRIMFPLMDHRDNVVGFSGRSLQADASGPKYINTRETIAYHKGDLVYGLHITKEAIRKENQAILVEGEFDVISCFKHGVSNVVAVKGTALTENQVNLLSRFAEKITVCFDGDNAGQEAIRRSLPIIEKKGLNTTVVVIPGGKDPDESLSKNELAFKMAVKHDENVYQYLLDLAVKTHGTDTIEAKRKIADDVLPIYGSIQNEIIKEHYLKKLSMELDTTLDSIAKELEKRRTKQTSPISAIITAKEKRSREELLEEYLVSLILQSDVPKAACQLAVNILSDSMTKERAYQKILHHLLDFFSESETFDSRSFAQSLPTELVPSYDRSLLFPLPAFKESESIMGEVEKVANQLNVVYLRTKMKELAAKIKITEKEGDEERAEKLRQSYADLAARLGK